MFQSSPVPKDGCNWRCTREGRSRENSVSILTRPEGRVQRGGPLARDPPQLVSILTRPEGRVQLAGSEQPYALPPRFNPHPSRRTGATRVINLAREHGVVSIHTRPEGRVQLGQAGRGHGCRVPVSILTRPEGRVQRTLNRVIPFLNAVSILTRPEGRVQPP